MQSDETVLTQYSDNKDKFKRNLYHSYHHK